MERFSKFSLSLLCMVSISRMGTYALSHKGIIWSLQTNVHSLCTLIVRMCFFLMHVIVYFAYTLCCFRVYIVVLLQTHIQSAEWFLNHYIYLIFHFFINQTFNCHGFLKNSKRNVNWQRCTDMLCSLLFMLALFLIIPCTLIFTAERLAVVRVHEGGKK